MILQKLDLRSIASLKFLPSQQLPETGIQSAKSIFRLQSLKPGLKIGLKKRPTLPGASLQQSTDFVVFSLEETQTARSQIGSGLKDNYKLDLSFSRKYRNKRHRHFL
ncbi:MAG TPA: hypothetical protein V6C65_10220 [Allocoleopsis sp.]